ncbi:MAG: flagellar biosynthesis protein FlhA [Planctomycetota bacterium]
MQKIGGFVGKYGDWMLGIGVLTMMVTLLTPLPGAVLDVMLAGNITLSLLLLLVTMNVHNSAELSTFPSILLFVTLLRLGLNVASTRSILSEGKAGTIITAFGHYVVGDNLMVGLVIFLILVIIQFVVITKGAGRISEVAARFVLDALPGKQMAIDADLNAGLIDSDQARFRREEVATEAEFYGAMDGASKFVRGDAIAGLIITALNLVGGIAMGSISGITMGEAVQKYSMLTIGDGLVSQMPALFISTAAAVLVTKATSRETLGTHLISQVSGHPKATLITAGMMFVIGLLPGMPATPFFVFAILMLVTWRASAKRAQEEAEAATSGVGAGGQNSGAVGFSGAPGEEAAPAARPEDEALGLLNADRVALEIGYRLIPLVQDEQGAGLLDHISQLRRRFASREGVVLPPVRIRDNIRMEPGAYRVLLCGQEVASGTIEPGNWLAMDGGTASGKLKGRETVDPAFNLPAWWIAENQRDEAELAGYTVVDPTSVLVTHLSEVLRGALPEILTRDDVKELVENARKLAPAVVEELIPDKMGYGEVQGVLRNLLSENVPVRNMPAILEAIADNVGRTRDPDTLTELVRQRLGRVICELYSDDRGTVHAIALDPAVEARLAQAVGASKEQGLPPVGPAYLQVLVERISEALGAAARGGHEVVVLARSNVRRFLNELVSSSLPKVAVLSYNEVVPAKAVETSEVVTVED